MWDLYKTAADRSRRAAQEKRLLKLQEYRRALQQSPRNADLYIKLAVHHKALGQHARALAVLKEGVEQCPLAQELYWTYLASLRECNRHEEAINALSQSPGWLSGTEDAGAIRMVQHLSLPILYASQEEIDRHRRRFQAGLSALREETVLDTPAGRLSALRGMARRYIPSLPRALRRFYSRWHWLH